MEILIGIALVVLIIYGLIKLIIFLAPYIAKGLAIILGAGVAVGIVVGVFYGIKNYCASISENISNKPLKVLMMVITVALIILMAFYLIAFGYFTANYLS